MQNLEREREARRKAEKASADKDAEIERLKKALEDSKATKATDKRDRFGSKSRLFYCSHAGARGACVIRSFTETCKQCGASIYEFFVSFFNRVDMGRTDYENMMPWCLVTNRLQFLNQS